MENIIHGDFYNQYELYRGSKNRKGFYLSILKSIYLMFNYALANLSTPIAGHIVIDNVKDYRISQVLKRIISNKSKIINIKPPEFLYISVAERKRSARNSHQHLIIIIDKGDFDLFKAIAFELCKYSRSSKAKLIRRKHSDRPDYINPVTGEVRKSGSAYLHNLRRETFDAFTRISYIAKVETKLSPAFSTSRILKDSTLIDTDAREDEGAEASKVKTGNQTKSVN